MNTELKLTKDRAHVLLAEDNPADRLTVERALEDGRVDCHLTTVENGEHLLALLRKQAPFEDPKRYPVPDLILMDINMPVMDGITALKHIRSDASLRSIPVIMLTTSDNPDDVDASYTDGANAYIVKPVTEKGFIDAVQQLDKFWFQLVTLPEPSRLRK